MVVLAGEVVRGPVVRDIDERRFHLGEPLLGPGVVADPGEVLDPPVPTSPARHARRIPQYTSGTYVWSCTGGRT